MRLSFSLIIILFLINHALAQKVMVTPQPTLQDKFGKKAGNIRFSAMTLKLGRILNDQSKTDTIRLYNDGQKAIRISIGKLPLHIEAHLNSGQLQPNAEGWLAVKFDAKKKNDYGFVMDHFEMNTDDSLVPIKTINITATIIENFPPMTAEDSAVVQKARTAETSFDCGKMKPGAKTSHQFTIINDGKRDLVIRKAQTSCNCLKWSLSKTTIAAGDTAFMAITFDSKNKEGKNSNKVSLFVNDPSKPEILFEMKGEIEN